MAAESTAPELGSVLNIATRVPRPGWWRRRSLRARITVVSTTLFTLALVIAAVVLLATIGRSLLKTLDTSAERTGNEVAALVQQGKLPSQLLTGSGGVSGVQVVDQNDNVISASLGTDAAVSILRPAELARARAGSPVNVSAARAATDFPQRVIAVRADIPAGARTVLVATDLGRVLDSSRLLERTMLFGGPLAVVLMAALTWWIVGRALRPVAALQRGAAELSAAGLSRSRLPVPTAHDEIHSLAATLNDMLDRLDTATTKQRRFVGDAAHELRSPIASLRVQLEVAQRLSTSPDLTELAEDALQDVGRLTALIDDLLALARSDERGGLATRAPVAVDELCASVVQSYGEARVRVRCADSPDAAGLSVIGDRDGLHRVLVNLVDNAVRYARSEVVVGVHPAPHDTAGRGVRITVTDDGPGIPENKRERVFDRFYRLDTARSRAAGGTGLGLSIVREIVSAHKGTVTLHDNEPGLRVEVLLPR